MSLFVAVDPVLHIGPSELMKLCDRKDEPDLLRYLIYAQNYEQEEIDGVNYKQDEIAEGFKVFTEKGMREMPLGRWWTTL
mmetsp:Transcript_19882/g.27392  ORF Transcript_19882/g.27392 Transcript_19882/m.27392 type:complete len:80 (+) Transcript_19882:2347-2586(+)